MSAGQGQPPKRAPARRAEPKPDRLLIVGLLIAFPLLVVAFARGLRAFVVDPLLALVPPPEGFGTLVTVTTWLLAAFLALGACRLLAGLLPRKDRDRTPR